MPHPRMPRQKTVAAPVRRDDTRTAPRYNFRVPARATIYPPKGCEELKPEFCQVWTRDLSCGGICFLHCTPLFESQRVDLRMPDGRGFTLAIRRITRTGDGRFVIGCRFVQIWHRPASPESPSMLLQSQRGQSADC